MEYKDKIFSKKFVASLLDVTSLNDDDTELSINALCENLLTSNYKVGSICIYPKFIKFVKELTKGVIPLTTVVNFPLGSSKLDVVLEEIDIAISDYGADEIDVVMPYKELLANNSLFVTTFLQNIRNRCNKTLKVIIETGELKTPVLIKHATEICIDIGADFVKTSTGKVLENATLNSVESILIERMRKNSAIGIKIAGGCKYYKDALKYLHLLSKFMKTDELNSQKIRFGSSSLFNNLLTDDTVRDNKQDY